jgi:hypothetical protein
MYVYIYMYIHTHIHIYVNIGDIRDPFEIPVGEGGPQITNHIKDTIQNKIDLILLGVALVCFTVLSCVLLMYYR